MPEHLSVLAERCDGCGECLAACPFFAIEVAGGKALIAESCVECGVCLAACTRGALVMAGVEGAAGMGGGLGAGGRQAIWVYLPAGAEEPGLAVVTAARRLADEQDLRVAAVLGREEAAGDAIAAGADEVAVLAGEGLAPWLLAEAARRGSPALILGRGGGAAAPDLAGLAALLGSPYVAGADELEWVPGERRPGAWRPIFGGRYRSKLTPADGVPLVATLDPFIFRRVRLDRGRSGPVRRIEVGRPAGLPPAVAAPLPGPTAERRESPNVALAEARVVVAGGQGLGAAENFARLYELRDKLAAVAGPVAVGAAREAVDAGWAPREALVDATVLKVAPTLYVAFGIDGNPTHNAAVAGSRVVVAVTPNAAAPILAVADHILPFDPATTLARMIAFNW